MLYRRMFRLLAVAAFSICLAFALGACDSANADVSEQNREEALPCDCPETASAPAAEGEGATTQPSDDEEPTSQPSDETPESLPSE